MATYDPNKSSARTDTIADWCRTEGLSAVDDIRIVPGVANAVQEVLRDNGIDTIAQLLGMFLMGITGEASTQEVCQAFYARLKEMIAGTRAKSANMHVVTFSVANFAAEKKLFVYDL